MFQVSDVISPIPLRPLYTKLVSFPQVYHSHSVRAIFQATHLLVKIMNFIQKILIIRDMGVGLKVLSFSMT